MPDVAAAYSPTRRAGDLVRMADWGVMNEVYGAFFGQNFPSRAAVGVELIGDALVEIEAIAYLPQAQQPT